MDCYPFHFVLQCDHYAFGVRRTIYVHVHALMMWKLRYQNLKEAKSTPSRTPVSFESVVLAKIAAYVLCVWAA